MQAGSQREFKDRMNVAEESYEKAKEFYHSSNKLGETPRIMRCND